MKTIIDINNFWSPSGGGVRRYHLEKMKFYGERQSEFRLVFLMQDNRNETEEISPTLTIEHIKAFKIPGKWWKYRFIFSATQIKKYILKYNPAIIEVGSPYILPAAVRSAVSSCHTRAPTRVSKACNEGESQQGEISFPLVSPADETDGGRQESHCESAAQQGGISFPPVSPAGETDGGRQESHCESAAQQGGISFPLVSPADETDGGRQESHCESAAQQGGISFPPVSPAGETDGGRQESHCESAAQQGGIHLVGFWHADFPVTYVYRTFALINGFLAEKMESAAWAYARHEFKGYAGIQVSSNEVMKRMSRHGLENLHWMPLGVDVDLFNPSRRDEKLVDELKAGDPNRLTMFFPHRFCREKGLDLLLDAYPLICEKFGYEPALVLAGTGPDIAQVRTAQKHWKHIRYIGFVKDTADMARWNASCELGFALSGCETFGLSILEGMASGQCLVGANTGAAAEHIRESSGGISIVNRDPQALALSVFDCAVNREKMHLIGANGRIYAEKFSWDKSFDRQMKFYNSIMLDFDSVVAGFKSATTVR